MKITLTDRVAVKPISFEDRGAGHMFRFKFAFSMFGTPFIAESNAELRAWLTEHVGARYPASEEGRYVVWDYAVLFRRQDDAFAFRMRWA